LDLVETALRRIGVTAETVIVDAAEFTPLLVGGSFDGSAAAWRDPDRERVLLFSQPYLENRLILVGRRGSDVSAKSLANLKSRRVAIVEGFSYGDGVDAAGPTFVRTRSDEDSIRQLLTGAVDHALVDEVVVQYIVDHHADQARAKLQLGSTPLITRSLHFAVRRAHPQAKSIIDRFNAQLRTMMADGTYNRLLHVGWIEADVDGDGLSEYVSQGGPRVRPSPNARIRCSTKTAGCRFHRRPNAATSSAGPFTTSGRQCRRNTRTTIRSAPTPTSTPCACSRSPGDFRPHRHPSHCSFRP
jgi:hypothetical protein